MQSGCWFPIPAISRDDVCAVDRDWSAGGQTAGVREHEHLDVWKPNLVGSVRIRSALQAVLILVTAAGLAVDAYVHFDLAGLYDAVHTNLLSQGDLFRTEAVAAVVAAAAILLRPRRYTAALAFVVASGGFAAVMIYRYVNIGRLGPLPSMYEPVWYSEKTQSAWAEGIASVSAAALFALRHVLVRYTSRELGARRREQLPSAGH